MCILISFFQFLDCLFILWTKDLSINDLSLTARQTKIEYVINYKVWGNNILSFIHLFIMPVYRTHSLLFTANGDPVPLKSQTVVLKAKNQNANFTVNQTFLNEESDPIEAYFTFPVPAGAAVYYFEAKTDDGTVVECKIKEKQKAKEEYNQAISSGNTAYYMERQSGDVFSVAVGNLAPLTGVQICFKFAVELKNEEDCRKLRAVFPLTIMPRYVPTYDDYRYGSNVNPPKVDKKPYCLSISGDLEMGDGIVSVESKTHRIKLSEMRETSVHFEIQDLDDLDKDIIITIERNDAKSHAMVQEFKQPLQDSLYRYCTCINMVPDFSKLAPVDVNNVHYVILLDRSGSMRGQDLEICKTAAQQFIALLPVRSTFDVYWFDDTFEKFSGEFNDMNTKKVEASKWVDKITAGGGTEILPVLEDIYLNLNTVTKPGVLLVLSDGGVSNTEQVIRLVKKNSNVSTFTIGIGSSVSRDLIQEMASQGNGHAEFIGSGDKNIIGVVRAQLRRSQDTLRKYQNDYTLEVNSSGGKTLSVPEKFPVLFNRTNNTIYMFSEFEPVSVTYTEKVASGETVQQVLVPKMDEDESCILHRIAATNLLTHLQHEGPKARGSLREDLKVDVDPHKDRIIQISVDLNVLSKYTAFIGVEQKKDPVSGDLKAREVPLQQPTKYRGDQESLMYPMAGCAAPSAFGGSSMVSRSRSFHRDMLDSCSGPASPAFKFKSKGGKSVRRVTNGSGFFAKAEARVKSVFNTTNSDNDEEDCCDDPFPEAGSAPPPFPPITARPSVVNNGHDCPNKHTLSKDVGVFNRCCDVCRSAFSQHTVSTSFSCRLCDYDECMNCHNNPKTLWAHPDSKCNVNLDGAYTSLAGDILTCLSNECLADTLLRLGATVSGLCVGDVFQVTSSVDPAVNGYYEIVSLGSDKEPWVLQKL